MAYDTITVTRQDAARAQINTAIDLILTNAEPVAVNVLTWAAVEMLRGVATVANVRTYQAQPEERVKPEYVDHWRDRLKGHYNFFKHSDRDPARVIEDFRPEATSWALFGACYDYARLYRTRTWEMLVYQQWFFCRHPNIALPPMSETIPKLASAFDYPEGKPFSQSIASAAEILRTGRTRPTEIKQMLGPNWDQALEM